ncbi:hypothetical protein Trydic_g23608 [Trypoxylus dichotomus]
MEGSKIPVTNEELLELSETAGPPTKDFVLQQTMLRIKDPRKTIPFYTGVLGMKVLQKLDFPEMKFSVYFVGYEDEVVGELGSVERTEWAYSRKGTLDLTHNWGTEDDPNFKYDIGYSQNAGFGHIGIMVPDVQKACERFEKLGVNFLKRPQDGKMNTIAFIADPDGYKIEIFNNKN